MRLAECDIKKDALVFQYTMDFFEIFGRIVSDLVRRTPWTAVNHCIESAFVKSHVYGPIRDVSHIANVDLLPDDAFDLAVALAHRINNDGGKVDA